jgi:hypothetical protein
MWDCTICNNKKTRDTIQGKERNGRNMPHSWKTREVCIMYNVLIVKHERTRLSEKERLDGSKTIR